MYLVHTKQTQVLASFGGLRPFSIVKILHSEVSFDILLKWRNVLVLRAFKMTSHLLQIMQYIHHCSGEVVIVLDKDEL